MSGGRLSENPTDASPEATIRARIRPLRGPLIRLRNTPFEPARSVIKVRHFPFRERSIATFAPMASGVRPQTRTLPVPDRNATKGNRNAFSDEDFGESQAIPFAHRNHSPDWTGPSGGPSRNRYQVARLTPASHIR